MHEDPFDGSEEYRELVSPHCGLEVYEWVKGLELIIEKHSKATVSSGEAMNWRKKDIFFDLPYWRTHLLQHNVDVHALSDCDMLLGNLLDINSKTKETLNGRGEMRMKLKKELHLINKSDNFLQRVIH